METEWRPAAEPFLHPGRAAEAAGLGWVGELHPAVAATWDLPGGWIERVAGVRERRYATKETSVGMAADERLFQSLAQ